MTLDDEQLLALAALDALGPDEQVAVEELLRRRPELRRELDELRLAAAGLVADDVAEPAPPSARDLVLARTADTPQVSAPPPPAVAPPISLADAARRRRRFGQRTWLAAAAVVAAVVGGGVVTYQMTRDDPAPVITAPRTMAMAGSLGDLSVTHMPDDDMVMVEGSDVPMPPDGMVYELWATADGDDAHPMGTFMPEPDGTVSMMIPEFDPTGMMLSVTAEPGEMDAPTGDVMAEAQA